MSNRSIAILLVLFLGGLVAVWWADYSKIPTRKQLEIMQGMVLPELMDCSATDIERVEISQEGKSPIAFERREGGRWQMVQPADALASASTVEALVRSLQGLRPVPGAERIETSDRAKFGLDHPVRTVRLFGEVRTRPLAALDLGKVVEGRRYVRDESRDGIDIVDAKFLGGVEKPAVDWRETSLFLMTSVETNGVNVTGPDREFQAQLIDDNWRLLKPYHALLDGQRLEGIVADLAALRVADGAKGFIADDVSDLAPYGLDRPRMRIELEPAPGHLPGKPQAVEIGKDVPDQPGRAYARRTDQNDVVLVDTKTIKNLGADPAALRSQRIAAFDPQKISYIQITYKNSEQDLFNGPDGWEVVKPSPGKADAPSVKQLLQELSQLQATEIQPPIVAGEHALKEPWGIVKIWQKPGTKRDEAPSKDRSPPREEPLLTLRLGEHHVAGKTVFSQSDDAPSVLLLPDKLLDALPGGPLAFRDKTLLALSPADVSRLTIERGGKTYEVESGGAPGDFAKWKMTEPVKAPADPATTGQLVVMLANLRAEALVTESPEGLAEFGLNTPVLKATWTIEPLPVLRQGVKLKPGQDAWTLTVGKPVPGRPKSHYARVSGNPAVFTIGDVAFDFLNAELHDRRLLTFAPDQPDRLTLRTGGPSRTFVRKPPTPQAMPVWMSESGSTLTGDAANQVNGVAMALSNLIATRYAQYSGPIPPEAGLAPPEVTIEVHLSGPDETRQVRLGALAGNQRFATTAKGSEGAVALVPEGDWSRWAVQLSGAASPKLPDELFQKDGK